MDFLGVWGNQSPEAGHIPVPQCILQILVFSVCVMMWKMLESTALQYNSAFEDFNIKHWGTLSCFFKCLRLQFPLMFPHVLSGMESFFNRKDRRVGIEWVCISLLLNNRACVAVCQIVSCFLFQASPCAFKLAFLRSLSSLYILNFLTLMKFFICHCCCALSSFFFFLNASFEMWVCLVKELECGHIKNTYTRKTTSECCHCSVEINTRE